MSTSLVTLEGRAPWRWMETEQAKDVIEALGRRENLAKNEVLFTRQGRTGGTWAHWQIALIYAHYLSPDLYLAWNDFARQCLDGTSRLDALERRLTVLERSTPRPRDAASYATGIQQVEDAIVMLGGRASTCEIRALLPHLSSAMVRVSVCRLLKRGRVRRLTTGCYELSA